MIIGYDASRAFIKNRTGTENYSYQLLKALAKIDRKNQYVIYVRDRRYEIRDKWSVNFRFKVIKWSRLWTQVGLAKQTFKDRLDVLFVPAHTLPVIRRPGLKTVVTVHDLGSEYLPKMHQLKQRVYLSFMQKVQLKGATKIIAVSKATKTDLISKIDINPNKIEVIYEGYDKDLLQPVKGDTLRDTLRSLDLVSGSYFLFIGTVQPRKNLERLIKAFHSVILRAKPEGSLANASTSGTGPDLPAGKAGILRFAQNDKLALVIVGSKGWLSDEIYALPKRLGIEKSVKFLGRVEDKDLPACYSGAIALTFPSLFEGFGLPIIEAQACGCPVITSNTSSMPEIAGKAAILVNAYDIESISKAMYGVLGYTPGVKSQKTPGVNVRARLIKDGFANTKRFSWEKAARKTLEVLEKV